jgi:DNA-directed RNA polymerase subunit RPC12/RpoP
VSTADETETETEPDPDPDNRTLRCTNCGFEAPSGDDWDRVDHPPIGTLTQCPECGSTDIHGR